MKRKSLLMIVTASIAVSMLSAGCAPQAAAPVETAPPAQSTPIVQTDGLGRSVTLNEPAKRIVSMAPSNTEILFAIGAGNQVIGRDEFSDYPEAAKSLPSIGGSFGQYNMEEVANLQPDLVLAAEINTPEQVKALEDLGVTVYLLPNPTDLNGVYQNLATVGTLTGHETEANALVQSLHTRVEAVTMKIAPLSYIPKVFYELDSTDPSAPYTAGPGTFIDLLIGMAGGFSAGSQLSGQWAQISVEELVVFNPEIILLGDAAYGVTIESVAQRPGWMAMAAVQNNKVYPFDDNLVSRPGPRLVDGLEELAKLLHPEQFK